MRVKSAATYLSSLLLCSLLLVSATMAHHPQPALAQIAPPDAAPAETQTHLTAQSVATTSSMKDFSGVHLGNKIHTAPDWTATELQRIDPALGGTWPSLVVVMSNQIYDTVRYPGNTGGNANYIVCGYKRTDLNLDGQTIATGPNNEMSVILVSVLLHPGNVSGNSNYIVEEQLP